MRTQLKFLIVALCTGLFTYGQVEKSRSKVGVSYTIGNLTGDTVLLLVIPLQARSLGGNDISDNGMHDFGVDYWYKLTKRLSLQSGFHYTMSSHTRHYFSMPPNPSPGYPDERFNLHVFSIPAGIQYDFLKILYVNVGVLFNFSLETPKDRYGQAYIESKNGLGFYWGLGLRYEFKNGIGIYAGPAVRQYNLFVFNKSDQSTGGYSLDGGIRFGLTYTFKPRKNEHL